MKQVRCKSLPDTFKRSSIKTGLLQTLQASDRLPGKRVPDLADDLLGVLEPLEQDELVMYRSFVGVVSFEGPVAP